MSEPARGWYPDPSGTPQLRWWNGHSWTNYVMPYAMQNQSVSKPHLPAHNEAVAPHGRQRLGARTAAVPAPRAEASAPRDTKAHSPLTAKRGATLSPTTETDSAPAPSPTLAAEATPASSMENTSTTSTQDAPKKHTTAHWALACAASWILVIAFSGVLVFTWSHLGDSNAIYEDAKEKARHAQEERDRAQSTLDDINRQIEEAQQ